MRGFLLHAALSLLAAVLTAAVGVGWTFVTTPSQDVERATHLARGIMAATNCGAGVGILGLVFAVVVAVVRAFARK